MADCNISFSGPGLNRAVVDEENHFKISINDKKTGQPVYPPDVTIRITSLDETEIVTVNASIGDDDQFWITYIPHREGDYIIELLQRGTRIGHDQPHCVYAQLKDAGDQDQDQDKDQADEEDDRELVRRACPRDQSANFKFTDFTGQGLKKVTRRKQDKKVKVLVGDDQKLKFVVEDDRGNRIQIPKDKLRVLVTPIGGSTQLVPSDVERDHEITLKYPDHPNGCIIEIFQEEMLIETLRIPGQAQRAKSTADNKLAVTIDPRSLKLACQGNQTPLKFSFENDKGQLVQVDPDSVKVIIRPPMSQPYTAVAAPVEQGKAFNVNYHGHLDGCEIEIYEGDYLIETLRIPNTKDPATLKNFLAILGLDDQIEDEESESSQRLRGVGGVPRHAELLSTAGNPHTRIGLRDAHGNPVRIPEERIKIKVRPPNAEPFILTEKVTYDLEGNIVVNNLVVFEDYEVEVLDGGEVIERIMVPKKLDYSLTLDPVVLRKVLKGEADHLVFQTNDPEGNPLEKSPVEKLRTRINVEGQPPFIAYAKNEGNGKLVLDYRFEPTDGCEIEILEGDDVKETFRLKIPSRENPNNRGQDNTVAKKNRNIPSMAEFPGPFETKKKGETLEVITHYPRKIRRQGDPFDILVIVRDKKTKTRHNEFKDIIKCFISGPSKNHVIHKSRGKSIVVESIRTPVNGQYLLQFNAPEPGKYKCMVKFEDQKVQWKKTVLTVLKKAKEKEPVVTEQKKGAADIPPEARKGPNPGEVEIDLNQMTVRRSNRPPSHKPNPFGSTSPR
eukprot:TRINITY_DN17348_c0_g1_i1.p1 TRINITY_DN17348_c0_g1~~TRINITY_DN17348_c0_g1_i1.p1  ORF type:complete len:796 (-),score=153.85 TRINITY_DN17348_c0_g1_i1:131-2476(-)